MKNLAIIGNPISHSLSPIMHNAAIKALDLDIEYSTVKVESAELSKFLEIAVEKYIGFNVTVPYKTDVLQYLDHIDKNAILGESVNTVVVSKDGKFSGFSTDGYGLEKALSLEFPIKVSEENFFFVGCGGAAKAAISHLLSIGVQNIVIANRSLNKAENFIKKLIKSYPNSSLEVCSLKDVNLIKSHFDNNPIIIQSTSLGLNKNDIMPLNVNLLNENMRVFDMIYGMTPFLLQSRTKGCMISDGRLMLLYQGVKSFKIWTGIEPPVNIMKNALFSELEDRG
ncbi:MAG TPA: shikimate dehydrogenase [Victivallales bacterium]|nr:shikimate dehydrogenase [Victivallales bacterium]